MKLAGITASALKRIAQEIEASHGFLHTSPYEYLDIDANEGLFGSFLFFVLGDLDDPANAYQMSAASKYVHYAEVDLSSIIKASELGYREDWERALPVIREVEERLSVDEDTALDLLSEDYSSFDGQLDADDSWWLQHATARAARMLGYRGVEITDEQGTAYLIDMLGWESHAVYKIGS